MRRTGTFLAVVAVWLLVSGGIAHAGVDILFDKTDVAPGDTLHVTLRATGLEPFNTWTVELQAPSGVVYEEPPVFGPDWPAWDPEGMFAFSQVTPTGTDAYYCESMGGSVVTTSDLVTLTFQIPSDISGPKPRYLEFSFNADETLIGGNPNPTLNSNTIELTPEPASMGLLAIGGLGVLLRRRRR